MRWRRICLWALVIFLVRAAIYFVGGFMGSTYAIYGIEVDDIVASATTFLLYFVFLKTIRSRHFRQLVSVFLVTFLLDFVLSIAVNRVLLAWVGKPPQAIFQPGDMATPAAVCMLAFFAWFAFEKKPVA